MSGEKKPVIYMNKYIVDLFISMPEDSRKWYKMVAQLIGRLSYAVEKISAEDKIKIYTAHGILEIETGRIAIQSGTRDNARLLEDMVRETAEEVLGK